MQRTVDTNVDEYGIARHILALLAHCGVIVTRILDLGDTARGAVAIELDLVEHDLHLC